MEGFNLTIILLPLLILFSSLDFKHKIIQWNCRGLKPNYNEVSLLISEYNPSVFCFQETFLKPDDNISLKGFNVYNYVHTDCLRPSGGASIFVKSSFPQRKIDLQTELQATAVSVTLDREITICYVYIPPSFSLEDSKVGCAVISDNHSNILRKPDDSSIFTAEAKAVDLALDFIITATSFFFATPEFGKITSSF